MALENLHQLLHRVGSGEFYDDYDADLQLLGAAERELREAEHIIDNILVDTMEELAMVRARLTELEP